MLNYIRELVSKDSKNLIAKHLKECPNCKKQFENMKSGMLPPKRVGLLDRIKSKSIAIKVIMICFCVFLVINTIIIGMLL